MFIGDRGNTEPSEEESNAVRFYFLSWNILVWRKNLYCPSSSSAWRPNWCSQLGFAMLYLSSKYETKRFNFRYFSLDSGTFIIELKNIPFWIFFLFIEYFPIISKLRSVLGSSYGLPVHVRTIFSSSGIGLDNFKLAREQHISRHAPSIGKYLFFLFYF